MNAAAARSIVVTGASTGIGRASVFALLDAGCRVFAGVRSERDAGALRDAAPADSAGRLEMLRLDVTDPAQIEAAVEAVGRSVGATGLWGCSTMRASRSRARSSACRAPTCGASSRSTWSGRWP